MKSLRFTMDSCPSNPRAGRVRVPAHAHADILVARNAVFCNRVLRMNRAATLAAVLRVVRGIVAQLPPDLSGTWTIAAPERAAGVASGSAPPSLSAHGDMGSGWGAEVTISQDASALTVVYTYFHPRE